MHNYMFILVLSLSPVHMNISPTDDLDIAFHLVDQRISDTNLVVLDIQDEGEDHQSLQSKNSTEGFKNGLDWIHFTGGGK
jgi:hypothetical protein